MVTGMAQIAIIGCGVVGSGTAQLLLEKAEMLSHKAGEKLELKYILDRKPLENKALKALQVGTFEEIESDPALNIVVEAIGGTTPAYDYVKRALTAGKNVVTSNKELIAVHGGELLEIAAQKNVSLLFEGSVGGGTPIIYPLVSSLWANTVSRVAGILNGTSNFILTKMFEEGMCFEDALALASSLGYAESDPSADVDGIDACRKLAVLASLAFGEGINVNGIKTEGIRKIAKNDVLAAGKLGHSIKLIAYAKRTSAAPQLCVMPMLVPQNCLISGVNGVLNAAMFEGDYSGSVMFYGRGAGKEATASAMVSDIILAVKTNGFNPLYSFPKCKDPSTRYKSGAFARFVRAKGKCTAENAVQIGEEHAFITEVLSDKDFETFKQKLAQNGTEITAELRVLEAF